MRTRYILSALFLACGSAMAADAPSAPATAPAPASGGWRQARSPQAAETAAGSTTPAAPRPGGVPAVQVQGPLPSPAVNSPLVQEAGRLDSELSADEIRALRGIMSENERAISAPVTSVVPRISTLTVSLAPGAAYSHEIDH